MKKLENDLEELRNQVIAMGNLTESMINGAVAVLIDYSEDRIATILNNESILDQKQLDIDKEAIRILTVYSPVAGDLRLVLSVNRITSELERIGDHAVNLCENIQLMMSKTDCKPLTELKNMSNVVCSMISDALDSFGQQNSKKAKQTIAKDDLVDALNDQILETLLSDDVVKQALTGPTDIAGNMAQILIARSLERIADQCTNICEEVVYMVKGTDIRHSDVETS